MVMTACTLYGKPKESLSKSMCFISYIFNVIRSNPGAASNYLRDQGIPGLRYKDQLSRNQAAPTPDYDTWLGYDKGGAVDSPALQDEYAGILQKAKDFENSGTHNYVMFDDKPISITERGSVNPSLATGIAGASTLGALAPIANNAYQEAQHGTIAPPEHPNVLRVADALTDVSQRLEGSPMGMLSPDATAEWLRKMAYGQKPSWSVRIGVLGDWL